MMFDRVVRMQGDPALAQSRRLKSKARFFPGGAPDAGTYAYRLSRQEHSSGWTGRSDA